MSPRYTHSFGTLHHAFPLMGVRAFMPPQGLLAVAAYLPEHWEIRFVDENIRAVTEEELRWADAVFLSGMHVQREFIRDLTARAHRCDKLVVLGGPSVSSCPEWYPEPDLLHVGELGDATHALVRRLDTDVSRPDAQEIYRTEERLPLDQFPIPAYHLLDMSDYFLGSIQFSSGCPYRCEFCDIPELYGRNPRLKIPEQVTAELDAMVKNDQPGAVYFVDDNFIGNRKAAIALLRELIRWQKERGYPVQFACEATLNLAQAPDILELMREAHFTTVFCGIETPEEHALEFIQKKQNLRQPLLEAVQTINNYGLEVVSGIILGFDTDTPTSGERIQQFIAASGIPMLTINILHALPNTPLWRRLQQEGRLLDAPGRESNVEFLLPYDTVVSMWRQCVTTTYQPEAVYQRFLSQLATTYPNRKKLGSEMKVTPGMVRRGMGILGRVLWRVGVCGDYRKLFWKTALPLLRKGQIEELIHIAVVSHHLILFARECTGDGGEACFYAPNSARQTTAPVG